jgi:carbonic anhydrase
VDGDAALRKLLEGNRRFVKGTNVRHDLSAKKRTALGEGQKPFAVILGCSDSRVPPELLFDQGLGDLFVIRVAGNIADDAVLGSIEYAVEHLHTQLVVVLGHEKCGAVTAALEGGHGTGHLPALVEPIRSAAEEGKKAPGDALDNAIAANVRMTVDRLRTCAPILEKAYRAREVKVVGARYDLDRGLVEIIW